MDPILGGALIGVGGSLLGNLFGWGSQNNANQNNKEIAQMNNEFNERMMNKLIAYNTEMWNKQNEYNTAANQRKRLEEAGLNPYMMMNGGSAGTASNAGSVSAAQSSGNPTMLAFRPDFSGLSQSINTALQLKELRRLNDANIDNVNANTEAVRIENQYKASLIMADLAERYERTNNWRLKNDYLDVMNFTLMTAFNTDMQMKAKQMYLMDQLAEGYRIDNLMKMESLKVLPEQLRANVAETLSRIRVNDKDATLKVMLAIKTQYETAGIRISNRNLERMSEDIIKELREIAKLAEAAAKEQGARADYRSSGLGRAGMFMGDFGGFLGSAAGTFIGTSGIKAIGKGISKIFSKPLKGTTIGDILNGNGPTSPWERRR